MFSKHPKQLQQHNVQQIVQDLQDHSSGGSNKAQQYKGKHVKQITALNGTGCRSRSGCLRSGVGLNPCRHTMSLNNIWTVQVAFYFIWRRDFTMSSKRCLACKRFLRPPPPAKENVGICMLFKPQMSGHIYMSTD